MSQYTVILDSDRNRRFALDAVRKARHGQQVKISKPTRTPEQNRGLHGALQALVEQLDWPKGSGEFHPLEFWKRACTLSWLHEINEHPEIITTLDGSAIGIFIPGTSDLTTEQCASLTEWIHSFGVTNGVTFAIPDPPPPDPKDYR